MHCPNDSPDSLDVRQQLETIYRRSPSVSVRERFTLFFRQIRDAIAHELQRNGSEPRISRYTTIQGHHYWYIYDPQTQQGAIAHSELELRQWLDRRYSA
jgi:hypothetical protein